MKKIAIIFMAMTVVLLFSCKGGGHSGSSAKHVGKWKESDGSDYYILFDGEGYVTECSHCECIGGKIKDYEGNKGNVKYKFDNDENPSSVELISTNDSTKKTITRRGIVKFVEGDKMQLKINAKPDGEKPKDFEGASHLLVKGSRDDQL